MKTFIEVCSGAGGLSTGFIQAGWKPLLVNDADKDCCETLRRNHPKTNIVCCPMDQLDLSPFLGKVDLFMGGVPCQSFSQAGLREGLKDKRGQLVFTFIDMITQLQPHCFLMENVKGLVSHDKGRTFQHILQLFQNIKGYQVVYKVLNAVDYHVPQKRERLFLIGYRSQDVRYEFPEPCSSPVLTLKNVLENVPSSPCASYPENKKKLFKKIPQGGCWVHLTEEEQRSYLGKSFGSGGGKRGILHRLDMKKPCLTLLCSPTQKQTERCHPLEERPLSVREYARIQTFDDTYQFAGSMASQYRQIGNAVPVQLAKHVALSLTQFLHN
jgi:DNA (cytosine-5)-methyltransferase 1